MDRSRQRGRGGFRGLGEVDVTRIGLPVRRARKLRLALAWRRIVGPALAERAEVGGVKRGILEIRLRDRRWEPAIRKELPRLLGRLSGALPELKIRKCRFTVEPAGTGNDRSEVLDVEDVPREGTDPPRAPGR